MKQRSTVCLCILLTILFCLPACKKEPGAATEPSDAAPAATAALDGNDAAVLTDGVTITEVFSYDGAFVEDGGNAPCSGICAVRLRNDGTEHIQYLRFRLRTANGDYSFAASTLFAGAEMTVLNETGAAFTDDTVIGTELLSFVLFTETPTVHTDTLEITYTDGFINVKNLTAETLSDVYVYYKDTDGGVYLGGITYRVHMDEIPAGQTAQAAAANLKKETGRVVFATYAP